MIQFFYTIKHKSKKFHGILYGNYQTFDKNAKSSVKNRVAKMMNVPLSTLSWRTEDHYTEGKKTPDFRCTELEYTDPVTGKVTQVGWDKDIEFYLQRLVKNERFYDFCITEFCN